MESRFAFSFRMCRSSCRDQTSGSTHNDGRKASFGLSMLKAKAHRCIAHAAARLVS
jgi:hypothetical protein